MQTKTTLNSDNAGGFYEPERVEFGINVNALIKNKSFNNAKTVILKSRGKAKCKDCKHLFDIKTHLYDCPKCHSYKTIIISGHELRVKTILFE